MLGYKTAVFALKKNILFEWLFWHFVETPKGILKAWQNILVFNLEFFSLALLFKTFFSPWRDFQWAYPKSLDLAKYLGAVFSNLVFRILGAMARTVVIIIGVFFEVAVFIIGLAVLVAWICLPFISLLLLWRGARLF